jgi:hypothetical protein
MKKGNAGLLGDLLAYDDETNTVEFKCEINLESDKEKAEFAKDVSALANTFGGCIVFGKEDKKHGGRIVGIDPKTCDMEKMQQIISRRCYPPPAFNPELIEKEGLWFALLEIPNSDLKPIEIVQTRDVWIRRGKITDKATQPERERMAKKKKRLDIAREAREHGIPETPESGFQKRFIMLGRWFMLKLHKRLDVSLRKDRAALGILGILSCVPLTVTMLLMTTSQGKYIPPQELLWFSVISAVIGLVVAPFLLREIPPLLCRECNKQFAIRRIGHVRIKTKVLSSSEDRIVRELTYYDTFRCDFCKNEWSKLNTVTRSFRLGDD